MILENRTYDELAPGDEASISRVCTQDDFYVFASSSGNFNPMHLSEGDGAPEAVAPSIWVGALISAVLGNKLPGPGTLYRSQSFRFLDRAHAGDELTITVRVKEKRERPVVLFETRVTRPGGITVVEGEAEVEAPVEKQRIDALDAPGLILERHRHFDALLNRAEPLDPIPTSVIAPEEANALGGAILAARHTIIAPILIGDPEKIAAAAKALGEDISGFELIAEPDHGRAAARGVALVHEGRAQAVMKGHLHTDELLHHIVKRDGGLRTKRRLSHVFVMDVPGLDKLLMVTDAAINIAPDLEAKVDIIQNAIYLAQALGVAEPKVGVLSAVETVNSKIPSTIDAAVLSKMADRQQIKGGFVDGPLAMDNAIDLGAARTKGITSMVAGRADILVAPNLEAGNMLAKQLTFAAHAECGGIVLGAQVPVILTSRSDDDKARLASCAIAALYQEWKRGHATEAAH
ncbi:MAG: bifunctional enoyl-CoA hydratase/phosphate acetyltransferase [Paracoccaceae bacterium]